MATIASLVADIRQILQDRPQRAKITAAITNTTTETFSTSAAESLKFAIGEIWEHEDSTGERREVIAVDTAGTITAIRGADGSTAATHLINTYILQEPRWSLDQIQKAIERCLFNDLFPHVYEIVKHQVTSNVPTSGNGYNSPDADCEMWLDVYQVPNSNDTPVREGITYTVYPQAVDTGLWGNGKMFEIYGGKQDGSAIFYVNCAHRLDETTLLERQEPMVITRAIQYLLEQGSPRRLQGPTNQGDRSVRPGDELRPAAYYSQQFKQMRTTEARMLKNQVPRRRLFIRGTVTYAHGD